MVQEETRCSECKSTMTYIRIKTNERVCRDCGKIIPLNIIEKEVIDDGIIKQKKERAIQED